MKKFKVTVNGQSYEVEVEEIGSVTAAAPVPAAATSASAVPAATPVSAAPAVTPAAVKAPAATAPKEPLPEGAPTIKAPMPGKISALKAKPGQTVARGDVVVVLEAMKMQNDITAPQDGTIVELRVQVGDSVKTGDILVVLK